MWTAMIEDDASRYTEKTRVSPPDVPPPGEPRPEDPAGGPIRRPRAEDALLQPSATTAPSSSARRVLGYFRHHVSLRKKLFGMAAVGLLMSGCVALAGIDGLSRLSGAGSREAMLAVAQRHHQDGDTQHDASVAAVNAALLAARGAPGFTAADAGRDLQASMTRWRDDLALLAEIPIDPEMDALLRGYREQAAEYMAEAVTIVDAAATDYAGAVRRVPALRKQYSALETSADRWNTLLRERMAAEERHIQTIRSAVTKQIVVALLIAIALLTLVSFAIGRGVVRQLRRLDGVASAVVGGDFAARSDLEGTDEIGVLAASFNRMADSLTSFVTQLEREADRDGFGSQLVEAFEVADEEAAAHEVVSRAMAIVDPARPMELLLADSSRAHLKRATASPTAGAPGCPVSSPFSCVAVRRGNPVVFDDSEALNACPRLRDRADGPISGVCIPVSFMGRALGVLHSAGPVGKPLAPDQVQQLATLATQAGSRIGTVRAFQTTQLQASTDGLTGLVNRRRFESNVRDLELGGKQYAFVIADLDKFKVLNDAHGHEVGDHALRLFSRVLRDAVRPDDIVSRLGGEEFALALPGIGQQEALGTLARIRDRLSEEVKTYGGPAFTASFGVTDSMAASGFQELLRRADAALYAAKERGRDRVVIADGEIVASFAGREKAAGTVPDSEPDPAVAAAQRSPLIHQSFEDDAPRPTGVEIR
jgi:diguanylate cyclase (GGDEF)-like protein